ncbi:MAG: hypothetical protein MK165_11060 [Pirellulaceae bacterium]|nr:hypothetical protein [Pirellulaceae bacterium]
MPEMPEGFDVKQSHVVSQWKHERPLCVCRFDPAGRYVFSGAEDNTVQRFDLADGKLTVLQNGHKTWVRALAISHDSQFVMSGGCEGAISWWEVAAEQPTPIRTIDAHQGWIRKMEISPDGQLLASAGNDGFVRLWNVSDGTLVREIKAHERDVYSLSFHPSGEFLLSGSLLGELFQWNVSSGEKMREFDAKALHSFNGGQRVDFGGIRGLAISPDGQWVAAGGLHKATNPLGAVHEPIVLLFNWETGDLAKTQVDEAIKKGVFWRLAWLADGSLMGTCGGGDGGYLLFFKTDAEKPYHKLKLPNTSRDMDLHPDGLQVCSAHYDRHLRISRLAAKQT